MTKREIIRRHLLALGLAILLPAAANAALPPGIPDGWSDGYAYANGIRIHYYHAVPAPGKPVIVMIHGITDNGLCWTTLTWKLQKDYDIYMPDTRGHGLSDPFTPSDNGDTLIKDVVGFVHAMKFKKPILMGHSMGAATVMRVGADNPDLATAIIMLDPFIGPGDPGGRGPEARSPRHNRSETNAATQITKRGGPPKAQPRAGSATNRLSVNMFGSPETLVAQNNYSFENLVAKAHRENPKWDMVDCQYWALSKKQYHGAYSSQAWEVMAGTMKTGDSLSKITVPALVLKAGLNASPEVRKATETEVSGMKHVKLIYIEGAAHNLHHDQLKQTVKVLREFLSTL